MAIRLRFVEDKLIAICAARSIEKSGDLYLDDGQHTLLSSYYAFRIFCATDIDMGYERDFVKEAEAKLLPMLSKLAIEALDNKFLRDFDSNYDFLKLKGIKNHLFSLNYNEDFTDLINQEESNNENRTWWDQEYGNKPSNDGKLVVVRGDQI